MIQKDQNYLLQGEIYRTGAGIKYGFPFSYYLAVVEKSELPRFEIIELDEESTGDYNDLMIRKGPLFHKMLKGDIKPSQCRSYKCSYCAPKIQITKPINWREV